MPTAVGASTRPGLWDLRAVHLGLEDQALGVHQEVPLPASNLLVGVVPPLFATYSGALGRLGVGDTRALGSEFLPKRFRSRSRNAALSCSNVPSTRHLPNHQ